MQGEAELGYETEQLEISTTILESVLKNLGDKIGQSKAKIQFLTEEQKSAFLLSHQRYLQREDEAELISEPEEGSDSKSEQDPNQQARPRGQILDQMLDRRQIPVSFEMSILLREKYFQTLEQIGRRLSVRFMVVPNKVKILGRKSELVDEAEEEFSQIQDKIRFFPVSEYGREIFNSKIFRGILKQQGIEIVKVLNKYYCWFEESGKDPADILKHVLTTTKHISIPLHRLRSQHSTLGNIDNVEIVHGQIHSKKQHTRVTLALLSRVKATIFQKYVEKELNRLQKREERRVELSLDRKDLILHLDAEQQVQIQKNALDELFEPFTYHFLVFDQEVDIVAVERFFQEYTLPKQQFKKDKSNSKQLFFFESLGRFVCLSFFQGTPTADKVDCTDVKVEEHELMKLFKTMPQQLMYFKLAVEAMLDSPEEDPEFKKFSFEKDFMEKITYVSLKNPNPRNFLIMLELYIQGKFQQTYKLKKEELNNAKAEVSQSVEIDLTRPVDQSSLVFNDSLNRSGLGAPEEQSVIHKVLPPELTGNQPHFRFENYTFCLVDRPQEREKRYTSKVAVTKRREISFQNAEYENAINSAGKGKFKLYRINVPEKYKQISLQAQTLKALQARPQLGHFNREVTVFYGGKDPKDYESIYEEGASLKVLRISEKNAREGYLLRTNLVLLFLQFEVKNTVQIPYGRYEALYFVKKIQ